MSTSVRIVQQPGCASVVLTDDGGGKRILFQHTREKCEGYIRGYIDGREDAPSLDAPVRCLPGDCRRMHWVVEAANASQTYTPHAPLYWLGMGEDA